MWMRVGVSVRPYHDDLSLQRILEGTISAKWNATHAKGIPPELWKDKHGYKRSPKLLYGLVVDEVYGYSESSRHKFPGVDMGDKNTYHYLNSKGYADTFIQCHNVKHSAAVCKQQFILKSVKNTKVSVNYRIGFLPQWREIQEAISKVILGFAIAPNRIDKKILNKPLTDSGD